LLSIRNLYREKDFLTEEYNEEPSPSSLTFDSLKGTAVSQVTRFNDYAEKRDIILKKIQFIDEIIKDFEIQTCLLSQRHKDILYTYLHAKDNNHMHEILETECHFSISTYRRCFHSLCTELYKHVDLQRIPTLEDVNEHFYAIIHQLNK